MRRIYFLFPDVKTARQVHDELLLARIEERHIHALARPDIPLGDLPEATAFEKSDFWPALERGLVVGGLAGLVGGILAYALVPEALRLGGGTLLLLMVVGAAVGSWFASMIGVSQPSSRLRRFEKPLKQGKVLIMVDVSKDRVKEIEAMVQKKHPEALDQGTEPHMPVFP